MKLGGSSRATTSFDDVGNPAIIVKNDVSVPVWAEVVDPNINVAFNHSMDNIALSMKEVQLAAPQL